MFLLRHCFEKQLIVREGKLERKIFFNSASSNKSLDLSKIYVNEKIKFVMGWVENIVQKGENAINQNFLPYS